MFLELFNELRIFVSSVILSKSYVKEWKDLELEQLI